MIFKTISYREYIRNKKIELFADTMQVSHVQLHVNVLCL